MMYDNAEAIQAKLAKKLGHRPVNRIWEFLVRETYVEEVEGGFADIDYLAEKYREFSHSPPELLGEMPRGRDSGRRRIRLEILSDLMGEDAARDPSVISFRERHLPGELIKQDEVGTWLSSKSVDDGEPTTYLKVPLPDGHELRWDGPRLYADPPLTLSVSSPATGWSSEFVRYQLPGDEGERSLPVRQGGVLDTLRRLSESLSGRYAWQKAQATVFALTGNPPLLSSLRGGGHLRPSQPISSRITMEIDPTLIPEEVVKGYKKLRDRWIKGRYRSMSEKHLRLAEFYRGDKDVSWSTLMRQWNEKQGEKTWIYREPQNFARDCKSAWKRLMGEDLIQYVDRKRGQR
jgi:hypothetical protein